MCHLQGRSSDGVALDASTERILLDVQVPPPVATASPSPSPTIRPTAVPTPRRGVGGFDIPDLGRRYPWLMIGLIVGVTIVAAAAIPRILRSRASLSEVEEQLKAAESELDDYLHRETTKHLDIAQAQLEARNYREAVNEYSAYFRSFSQSRRAQEQAIQEIHKSASRGLCEALANLADSPELQDTIILQQARLRISQSLDAIRLDALATRLPQLWSPKDAVRKLYSVLESGGQAELIEAIGRTDWPPLASLASELGQATKTPEPRALHQVYLAAQQQTDEAGKGLAAFYRWLEKLVNSTLPITDGRDTQDLLAQLEASGPEIVNKLAKLVETQLLYKLDWTCDKDQHAYWTRAKDNLETGLATIKASASGQLPEVRILTKLVGHWRQFSDDKLQQFTGPPELLAYVSPSLTLRGREEEVTGEGEYWRINLPICIYNKGQRPAHNIRVTVLYHYGGIPLYFDASSRQTLEQSGLSPKHLPSDC